MAEISCPAGINLSIIPDNLTIPQFFLDSQHPVRPLRQDGVPWLIDDQSGRPYGFEEVEEPFLYHPAHQYLLSDFECLAPCTHFWFGECTQCNMEYW